MKNSLIDEKDSDEKLLQIAARIDKFEGYVRPHARRVAVLSEKIAEKFTLSSYDCLALRQSAFVHDIGESVMNREYIKINRPLSADERDDVRRHPVISEQEAAKRGLSRAVQLLVRWHHEWWNGAGYPDSLKREQIPLGARILRVADTFAALTDSRPFRAAVSVNEAEKYLIEWAGIEFDPLVVKTFISLENLPELKSFADEKSTKDLEN